MKSLYETHVNLVGKVMDMQLQRQNVVMSNIANVRTPGYKPRELEFEKQLQAALGLDAKGRMTRTEDADWEKAAKPRVIHGEDRVNLDKEMAKMAKNSLHYTALSTVIRGNFEGVKNIIQEGQK